MQLWWWFKIITYSKNQNWVFMLLKLFYFLKIKIGSKGCKWSTISQRWNCSKWCKVSIETNAEPRSLSNGDEFWWIQTARVFGQSKWNGSAPVFEFPINRFWPKYIIYVNTRYWIEDDVFASIRGRQPSSRHQKQYIHLQANVWNCNRFFCIYQNKKVVCKELNLI